MLQFIPVCLLHNQCASFSHRANASQIAGRIDTRIRGFRELDFGNRRERHGFGIAGRGGGFEGRGGGLADGERFGERGVLAGGHTRCSFVFPGEDTHCRNFFDEQDVNDDLLRSFGGVNRVGTRPYRTWDVFFSAL